MQQIIANTTSTPGQPVAPAPVPVQTVQPIQSTPQIPQQIPGYGIGYDYLPLVFMLALIARITGLTGTNNH